MQAEHSQIPAKLCTNVVRTSIGFALGLQIHQHELIVVILTPQQTIKRPSDAAIHVRQPVLTGHGLIRLPNGMLK